MASKKLEDKLSKLANFGQSAGSKPAAAAVASMSAPTPIPELEPGPIVVPLPEPVVVPQIPVARPVEATNALQPAAPKLLIRNVGFNAEDQARLDRIANLLQASGEFRPSISDLVRVALWNCEGLTVEQAKAALDESRKFDGRRKR